MKKIFLIILSMCFLALLGLAPRQNVYHNLEGHFSFVLPDGWLEYSQKDLATENQQVEDISDKDKPILVAFYKKIGPIIYADMNIQIDAEGRVPEDDIQKNLLSSQGQQQLVGGVQTLVNDKSIEFWKMLYDKEKNIIYSKMWVNDGRQKQIRISAMLLSSYGFATVTISSLEKDLKNNLADFTQIIDSFRFDDGFGY